MTDNTLSRIAELKAVLDKQEPITHILDHYRTRSVVIDELAGVTSSNNSLIRQAAYCALLDSGLNQENRLVENYASDKLFSDVYARNRAVSSAQFAMDICSKFDTIRNKENIVKFTAAMHLKNIGPAFEELPEDYLDFALTVGANYFVRNGDKPENNNSVQFGAIVEVLGLNMRQGEISGENALEGLMMISNLAMTGYEIAKKDNESIEEI